MYTGFQKTSVIHIRVTLSMAWLFSTLAGLSGIFLMPMTVAQEIGEIVPTFSGLAITVGGVLAILGVVVNKYYFEWVGSWLAMGGMFVYAIAIWQITLMLTPTRAQQACTVTAVFFFFAVRAAYCAAHAKKQRMIHAYMQEDEAERDNS